MKFKTVAEAFNYYRNHTFEAIEQRAREIQQIIDTDANADIEALNVELRGLKEARENAALRTASVPDVSQMRPVAGMQTGKTFTEDTVFDSAEYRSAFFKHVMGGSMSATEKAAFDVGMKAARRSDAFISSTEAAAVMPTETLNEIVKKATTEGGLLAACRMFNVPSNVAIPVGTLSDAAAWHTEGAAVDAESLTPAKVTFGGYEIIKIFSMSLKARRMSIPAFESYLTDELSRCVLETLEAAIVTGTGSGQGTGLETGITWTKTGTGQNCIEVAANKSLAYGDIVEALALLKRGYGTGAKFAMNSATLYRSIYSMVDDNKRPVFIADLQNGGVGRILGHDIILDDHIPDDVLYLGDFRYFAVNIPEGVTLEASTDSSFRKGLIDYRATMIADCKPIVSEAFVRICKASA